MYIVGYTLDRFFGFGVYRKHEAGSTYSIPVHHGKVKPFYIREIKKQIGED